MKPKKSQTSETTQATPAPRSLVSDLRGLIQSTRETLAQAVDSALTTLYWQIGRRVQQDILKNESAGYGAEIVSAVGRQLAVEFGEGFAEKSRQRIIHAAGAFPEKKIVATLSRLLGWSHFLRIIRLENPFRVDSFAGPLKAGIRGASFWTDVLPKQELERKLHKAVFLARARLGPGKSAGLQT